jgi:hypothetical protein
MTRGRVLRWWPFVGLTMAAVLGGCARPAGEAEFTEKVAAGVRAAIPDAKVTVIAPRTLEVRFADGTLTKQRLDNLWLQCNQHPEACEASTARVVRTLAEGQATRSSALRRENVLATLKDRPWLDATRKSGVTPVVRPFAGDLWTVYVFDLPDAMRVVDADDLPALKLNPDQLDALAMDNLGRRLAGFPHEPVESGSPVQVLHAGDSYESARLLLHDRWRDLKGEVKGDLLVSAPSRDYVYFVGRGESPEFLRAFRQRMNEIARDGEHHPLSSQILRWVPEGWVVWDE